MTRFFARALSRLMDQGTKALRLADTRNERLLQREAFGSLKASEILFNISDGEIIPVSAAIGILGNFDGAGLRALAKKGTG